MLDRQSIRKWVDAALMSIEDITTDVASFIYAQNNDKVITACIQNENGQTRIVNSLADCRPSEFVVQWNAEGQQDVPGPAGANGADGVSCWDTNGNGFADPNEDINGDRMWDALACQGQRGSPVIILTEFSKFCL